MGNNDLFGFKSYWGLEEPNALLLFTPSELNNEVVNLLHKWEKILFWNMHGFSLVFNFAGLFLPRLNC
jgi:hypothetical protein